MKTTRKKWIGWSWLVVGVFSFFPVLLAAQTYEVVVSNQYETTFIRTFPESFPEHTVDGSFNGAQSVYAADIDGDGDTDVLGGAYNADDVAWWENIDGSGTNWSKHFVHKTFNGVRSVHAADIDGDGDLDMLAAAVIADDVVWWENADGTGTNLTEHTVDSNFNGAQSVFSVDVDNNNTLDVLCAGGSVVALWKNNDGSGADWTKHVVDDAFTGARSVYAEDMDGDGDVDILAAAPNDSDVAWWENTDGNGTNWVKHVADGNAGYVFSVYPADLDGDGDQDILSTSGGVTWLENIDGNGLGWLKHSVDGAFGGSRFLYAEDVDGDGDMDILGAASDADDIAWWENAEGTGSRWIKHIVDGSFDLAVAVHAKDVNGDGKVDILGAAYNADDITWWKNAYELATQFDPPSDTNVFISSTNQFLFLTNRVATGGSSTQFVAVGWSRTGSDPDFGEGIHTGIFTLTNDAVITFNWVTQCWLNVASDENGSVDADDGWYNLASNVTLTAIPAPIPSCSFAGWSGDVPPTHTNENPLTLTMDHARNVTANFSFPINYEMEVNNPYGATFVRKYLDTFSKHTVAGNFSEATSVFAMDMDGDGDVDLLGAAEMIGIGEIAWWENTDGQGSNWSKRLVNASFSGACSVYATDLDGDGDEDVLGAAWDADDIAWWENTDGSGLAWNKHTVIGNFTGARSVCAADVDGDGDMDILGAASGADDIVWWENTDGHALSLSKHTVDADFAGANCVYAEDVDGDGDVDILGAASGADDIAWWENVDGSGGSWVKHTVDGSFDAADWVYAKDVDSDGDMDVLGAARYGDKIVWWENQNGIGTSWTERAIDNNFEWARCVHAADVDGDGDIDVLGAAGIADDITLWENNNGAGTSWTEHTLAGGFDGASAVFAADVNGDGALDVIGSAGNLKDIAWWENETQLVSTFNPPSQENEVGAWSNVYAHVTNEVFRLNDSTQYVCTGWIRSGNEPNAGDGSNTGRFSITNDVTITFNWGVTQYWLQASAEKGTVDGGNHWYNSGSNVTVTAEPVVTHQFAGWSGDVDPAQTNENPLTLSMSGSRDIVAHFVPRQYEVVVSNQYETSFVETAPGEYSTFYASAWTNTLDSSTNLSAFLTNTVIPVNSTTQLVYSGWVRTGSDPGSGSETNTGAFSLTNDAVIVFKWRPHRILPGSGTEADPYRIESRADFDGFATSESYWAQGIYTRLDTDLDLDPNLPGGVTYTTAVIAMDTNNSLHSGFNGVPFSGVFDGNGHIIRNLTIDTAGAGNDYLGLFGKISGASSCVKDLGIEDCSISSGSGSWYMGGLSAYNQRGEITKCYADGTLSTGDYSTDFGGFCGSNWDGAIRDCYARVAITATDSDMIGGFCAYNYGVISNCYSAGEVSVSASYVEDVGGLCGRNEGTISASFWDKNTSGRNSSAGGTGKTTSQMKTQSTFTDAGWDFADETVNGTNETWSMDGYPILTWELPPPTYLPFSETFENDGNNAGLPGALDGQNGWNASVGASVQTGTVFSGSQALELSSGTASHSFAGAPTNVCIDFRAKFAPGNVSAPNPTDTAVAVFHIDTNGHLVAWSNTTPLEVTNVVLDADWHHFKAYLDYSAQIWDLKVDDVLLVDDFAFYRAQSHFTKVAFRSGSDPAFFDDLYISHWADGDADADGLPDWWEIEHYGGTGIHPGDMASNGVNTVLAAYIAGIDPTDPNDCFTLSRLPGSVLSWHSASGRVYTLYWSSNLLSGFQILDSHLPWTAVPYADTNHIGRRQGYYKIDVQLE